MEFIYTKDFDLSKTIESGQIFHYKKVNGAYLVASGKKAVLVKQQNKKLLFEGASKEEVEEIFGLKDNLNKIYNELTKDKKDKILTKAINEFYGMRIIKQDPFECLISYIASINSNIPRIKESINFLSQKYGEEIEIKNYSINLFPSFKVLKNLSEKQLREAKLGFRAKYIKQTLSLLPRINLYSLKDKSFEEAKQKLKSLPGVGDKVAECVLLYSFKMLEAFPIDVWIKRIIMKEYLKKEKVTNKEIRDFATKYFGNYAGYAQLYLFCYARKLKIK